MKDIAIVYQPKVLRSMREICEEMGVGEAVVKRWIAEGAPVAVEGQGRRRRYSAEMLMLQAWRVSSGGAALPEHQTAVRERPASGRE